MRLSTGMAFPSVDNSRTNMPAIIHSGLTAKDYLYIAAIQGALASGKDAAEAVLVADNVIDIIDEVYDAYAHGTTSTPVVTKPFSKDEKAKR